MGGAGTGGSAGASGGGGDGSGNGGSSGSGASGGGSGTGGRILESVPRPLGCSADGWCWSNPSPIGSDFSAVWVTAENDVWVAGERGAIIHFDGNEWSQTTQATSYYFFALWASGPSDVWAVGSPGAILHYDGNVWRDYSVPALQVLSAVWGSAPNDVWAAGLSGALYHFDGLAWSPVDLGTTDDFRSLWGAARDDIWMGTDTGFRHYDGRDWNIVSSPVDEGGWSFDGAAWNDIWSATADGVLHFDGMEWRDMDLPANGVDDINGVWLDGDGAVWTSASFPGNESLLFRYEDGAWTSIPLGVGELLLRDLKGSPGGPIWIVGMRGQLVAYDGQSAHLLTTDVMDELDFGGVIEFASNDRWVCGGGDLFHDSGSGWIEVPLRTAGSFSHYLWAPTPNDIWSFADDGNIDRFDRATWTNELRSLDSPIRAPKGIWGTIDDLWIAGNTSARHVNGTWSSLFAGDGFHDVWASAPDDVWLVGGLRCWAHWHDGAWERLCLGNSDVVYRGVWGSASNDVWLVGTRGNIHHNQGSGWVAVTSGTVTDLHRIWGNSATDLWVVGAEGLILHSNGGAWTPQESGTDRSLEIVTGSSANSIWASGNEGVILHRTQSYRN